MSENKEGMPFVPEEDLDLHENFSPIIAENGVIYPSASKHQESKEDLPAPDATFTRMDTIQDLVQIRSLEQKSEETAQQLPPEESAVSSLEPLHPEKTSMQTIPAQDPEMTLPSLEEIKPIVKDAKTEIQSSKGKSRSKKRSKPAKSEEESRKKGVVSKKDIPPTTPKQPVSQTPAPGPKKRSRWQWIIAIVCFLFLGTISGVVPVEKIPFLRNLAYAMGFSKDDTSRMSFLRALLTWTDKTIGLPGQWGTDESRDSLWARTRGEGAQDDLGGIYARMERASGKTSLIDINALNELQRQKGRQLDGIRAAVVVDPRREQEQDPAALRDSEVNVRTEANQDKGDVFFGSDATSVNRDFKDGYDSVNTLKKIANPYIANGEPIDWLKNMTKRMMKSNMGIGGINKELGSIGVLWGSTVEEIGEQKPHRDLYHAWITSRMAKYTDNLMLKKALADTGFWGAELPTMAADVLGFGGVQIDSESFQEDQEAWKEYLEFEKKCKAALNSSGGNVDKLIKEFNALVTTESNWDFPANCAAPNGRSESYEGTKFDRSVQRVEQICQELDTSYNNLEEECKMVIRRNKTVNCTAISGTYATHWTNFQDRCNAYFNADFESWWSSAKQKEPYKSRIAKGESEASVKASARGEFEKNEWTNTYGPKHTEEKFVTDLSIKKNQGDNVSITSMREVVIDQQGGSSEYFPTVDLQESVEKYLEQNEAM